MHWREGFSLKDSGLTSGPACPGGLRESEAEMREVLGGEDGGGCAAGLGLGAGLGEGQGPMGPVTEAAGGVSG